MSKARAASESEYSRITNLTNLRNALTLLRNVIGGIGDYPVPYEWLKKTQNEIYEEITKLERTASCG